MMYPVIMNIITRFRQIKLLTRIILLSLPLNIIFSANCRSQDIYDQENSLKYADFLFSGQQYTLAAEEYERLIYFDKHNPLFRTRLIMSYRLSGDLKSGIKRIYSLYGDSLQYMPERIASEFTVMELLTDSVPVAMNFIGLNTTIDRPQKAIYTGYGMLLSGDYRKSSVFYKKCMEENIQIPLNVLMLSEEAERVKFKSPFLAGSLSAIVPGSGKFYTKNWTDGIISFLFVATNTWQAYRGFSTGGIRSGYGWVFTGLSSSFYIGNIFGSAKAARRYNENKKSQINNRIYEIIRSDNN